MSVIGLTVFVDVVVWIAAGKKRLPREIRTRGEQRARVLDSFWKKRESAARRRRIHACGRQEKGRVDLCVGILSNIDDPAAKDGNAITVVVLCLKAGRDQTVFPLDSEKAQFADASEHVFSAADGKRRCQP